MINSKISLRNFAERGDFEAVHRLLMSGVTATISDLCVACAAGKLSVIKIILSYQPELINQYDSDGITPLLTAIASRRATTAMLLLALGAHPDKRDIEGDAYPIEVAICLKCNNIIPALLSYGANAKRRLTNKRLSLITLAVKSFNFDALSIIISHRLGLI